MQLKGLNVSIISTFVTNASLSPLLLSHFLDGAVQLAKYLQPNACDTIMIWMNVAHNKHHFVQTTNIKMSQPAAAADVRPQRALMENLDITREAHH